MDLQVQQVTIVQRQTVDWTSLSDEAFRQQSISFCRLWGKPDDYVYRLFELWNSAFSMDYREVRQRLKEVARENIQQVSGISFVPYENYKNISEQQGYYLFLDDDDWLGSNVVEVLGSLKEQPPLVLWRSANIGSPNQQHPIFVWGMNGRCMTNNYAVHSRWLRPFEKIQQVIQHKNAQNIIDNDKTIPHIDYALTVSNKSPISSVSLDRGLNGELQPEKLLAMVEQYLEKMSSVAEAELAYIPWARGPLDQTVDLFGKVLASQR